MQDIQRLVGLDINHVWLGYGTALFIELGKLSPPKKRRDGSLGNPKGECTIDLNFYWRFEKQRSIYFGSADSKRLIENRIKGIIGTTIEAIKICGRLPELEIKLGSGIWITTFTQNKGQPEWAILFENENCIEIKAGKAVSYRK